MASATRFEDLVAWQKARALVREVYLVSGRGIFARDFDLARQIRRASVSVMSNIAEGFDRSRPTEFHQYLSIAKGSCAEVRSQLYVAHDLGYLDADAFRQSHDVAVEASKVVAGLRSAVHQASLKAGRRIASRASQHSALSTLVE